jgi:hypothetical protein
VASSGFEQRDHALHLGNDGADIGREAVGEDLSRAASGA